MKQILLPLLGAAFFIIVVGLMTQKMDNKTFSLFKPSSAPTLQEIKVGGVKVKIEMADTEAERKIGLSERKSLDKDQGMLFFFNNQEVTPGFWMKDMLFPLDIIWIKNGKIIKIDKNVPIPEKGETSPKLYYPPSSINYVLEVNAGFCDQNQIKVGDRVEI